MQNGVKPNVRTYTALITALGNAKQWKRALKTLEAMKHDTSGNHVEPNAYTYSALLKALGEHGQWAMAEKVSILLYLCFWTPPAWPDYSRSACFRTLLWAPHSIELFLQRMTCDAVRYGHIFTIIRA